MTWMVMEDNHVVTDKLKKILEKFSSINILLSAGILPFWKPNYVYVHILNIFYVLCIIAAMPIEHKMKTGPKPRGVAGKNPKISLIF